MSDRILRLQHVEVRVPDLELCTAYYTEVVGLIEVAHEEGRVFLKCWDEHEHHSVVLRQAPTYGLDHMSFKVAEQPDLDYYTERVEKAGIAVKRFARAELGPGWGEAIRFEAPSGHLVELVYGMEKVGNMLPLTNPPPRPANLVGIAPPRLDHIFIMAEDVDGVTAFFREVLEFRLTEQIIANDGHQLATWLERSHTPHDIAIVTGPNGALHHFAFWLDDWNGVREAADLLAFNGVTIDVAPDQARRHPRLHRLLLRPGRQQERGLHRRLLGRPGLRADHLDRGGDGPGHVLLPPPGQRALLHGAH